MKHRHLLTTAMALIYGNSINFGATDLVTDFRASSDAAYVCYQNARAGIQAKGKMLVDEKKQPLIQTIHCLLSPLILRAVYFY